jgi:hypothetical protein
VADYAWAGMIPRSICENIVQAAESRSRLKLGQAVDDLDGEKYGFVDLLLLQKAGDSMWVLLMIPDRPPSLGALVVAAMDARQHLSVSGASIIKQGVRLTLLDRNVFAIYAVIVILERCKMRPMLGIFSIPGAFIDTSILT